MCVLGSIVDRMSSRVSKGLVKKSKSKDNRAVTSLFITERGYEVVPCSRCFDRGCACLIVEDITRCAICYHLGYTCNSSGAPISSYRFLRYYYYFPLLISLVVYINNKLYCLD